MKNILILAVIFLAACQQEPKEEVIWQTPEPEKVAVFESDAIPAELRSGEYYPLFYKESLTTDNYLLYPEPRKQTAYVKSKVDSVFLVNNNSGFVNISGIPHAAYKCRIKFKDGTYEGPTLVTTVLGANNYGYVPYGDVVVHNSINGKKVSLTRSVDKVIYKEWRTCANKNKYKYEIRLDTAFVGYEYLFGTSISGTGFLMAHK